MKNYILDINNNDLVLFLFDENLGHFVQAKKVTMEKLFEMLDKLIDSKCNIEKMNFNNDCLNLKVVYFFDDCLFKEEDLHFKISNRLLNNEEFRTGLYQRFNKYNAIYREETINNIASKKFDPNNIRKRRLMIS